VGNLLPGQRHRLYFPMRCADSSRETFDRLESTFFPYMRRKRARVGKGNLRFIHYTDGEAALQRGK
jgi:hypothetical protein